jgi:hypothetical protein
MTIIVQFTGTLDIDNDGKIGEIVCETLLDQILNGGTCTATTETTVYSADRRRLISDSGEDNGDEGEGQEIIIIDDRPITNIYDVNVSFTVDFPDFNASQYQEILDIISFDESDDWHQFNEYFKYLLHAKTNLTIREVKNMHVTSFTQPIPPKKETAFHVWANWMENKKEVVVIGVLVLVIAVALFWYLRHQWWLSKRYQLFEDTIMTDADANANANNNMDVNDNDAEIDDYNAMISTYDIMDGNNQPPVLRNTGNGNGNNDDNNNSMIGINEDHIDSILVDQTQFASVQYHSPQKTPAMSPALSTLSPIVISNSPLLDNNSHHSSNNNRSKRLHSLSADSISDLTRLQQASSSSAASHILRQPLYEEDEEEEQQQQQHVQHVQQPAPDSSLADDSDNTSQVM